MHETESINIGDWFLDSMGYFQIADISKNELFVVLRDVKSNPSIEWDAASYLSFSECKKITDERSLKFLTADREPNEWEVGDLAIANKYSQVEELTESIINHCDYILLKTAIPICFVEDRLDRK